MEAEWEKTDEFHSAWKAKSREMLARAEFRRRKLTKRVWDCHYLCLWHACLCLWCPLTCRHGMQMPERWAFVCEMQLKEETERLEEEEGETRKKMKATREHTKKWEETRENRVRPCVLGDCCHSRVCRSFSCPGCFLPGLQVGTWRNFVDKKVKAKKVPADPCKYQKPLCFIMWTP